MSTRSNQATREVKDRPRTFSRLVDYALWILVFLEPLFFLPFTTDPVEINKATLFYLIMIIASGLWFVRMLLERKGHWQKTPFDIPLAIFLLFTILATVFSLYHVRSLAGTSGYVSGSLMSVLFFVLFFVLLTQTLRRDHLGVLMNALLLSGAVLVLFNFFQVFGTFLLPWDFSHIVSFNALANSGVTFSLFLALLCLMSMLKAFDEQRPVIRILSIALGLVSLFLIGVYDQAIGWVALSLGLLVFLLVKTTGAQKPQTRWLLWPSLFIALSLLGLFSNTQQLLRANIPGDTLLPPSVGWQTTLSTLKDRPFGTGPATFDAASAKYRPIAFNTTQVWNLRFIKSSNEWFQQATTTGIVATIALLVLVGLGVLQSVQILRRIRAGNEKHWHELGVGVGLLLLALTMFLIPFNFILSFLLWFFLAAAWVLVRSEHPREKLVGATRAKTFFWPSLGLAVLTIGGIATLYYGGRFWMADVFLARANTAVRNGAPLDRVQNYLTWSLDLNPSEQSTYFNLAQNFFVQAQIATQDASPDVDKLRTLVAGSVGAGQSGAQLYKEYSGSYQALATLYYNIDQLTGAASEETLKTFLWATELEPNNPQLFLELGHYYIGRARFEQSQDSSETKDQTSSEEKRKEWYQKAREAFNKALELKADFVAADISLALVDRLEGKAQEATERLEKIVAKNAYDSQALYALAENYLLDERQDEAVTMLERLTEISPDHADAHLRLAQLYDERGDLDRAIAEMEIVRNLNPNNPEIKGQLEDLKRRRSGSP